MFSSVAPELCSHCSREWDFNVFVSQPQHYAASLYDWRVWLSSAVLADLPLPTHLPTPMEQHTLGKMGLKGDSTKWLNNVDPALCTKISQALMSVDSSFL